MPRHVYGCAAEFCPQRCVNGALGVRVRSRVVRSAPPPPLMLTLVSPLAGPRDLWRSPRTTIKAHPAHEDTGTGVCEINARPGDVSQPSPIAPESQCWLPGASFECKRLEKQTPVFVAPSLTQVRPTLRSGGYQETKQAMRFLRSGVYFANTGMLSS